MTIEQRNRNERNLKQRQNEYAIKETWHKIGFKEGVEETQEKWRLDKIETIHKLLNQKRMSVSEIAELVSVDEAYVLEIKNAMRQK